MLPHFSPFACWLSWLAGLSLLVPGCNALLPRCCLVSSKPRLSGTFLILQLSVPKLLPVSCPTSGTLLAALSCVVLLGNLLHTQLAGKKGVRDLHHAQSPASPLRGACLRCSAGAAGGVRGVTAAVSSAPQGQRTSSRPVWAATQACLAQ